MEIQKVKFSNIDVYIALQEKDKRKGLEQIRQAIKKAVPQAREVISYNMPAFKFNGMLVWFAVAKNHYGLYPYALTIEVFKDKLKDYECSKGTVRFPLDKPLPVKLIAEMAKFRAKQNIEKQVLKKAAKKK